MKLCFARRATLLAFVGCLSALAFALPSRLAAQEKKEAFTVKDLPSEASPAALSYPHFPDVLHALVWRNWQLVPIERIAQVVSAKPAEILEMGHAMGLDDPPPISADQQLRSAITIIKRNWHLLPYDQLLALLGWTPEQLNFTLREDDFLFTKLGRLKPKCDPVKFERPNESTREREAEIARITKSAFPSGVGKLDEPLFGFVADLSKPVTESTNAPRSYETEAPRFCYSYFALYGDPLLDKTTDPYPDGYLQRLAASGVNGVWLQGVLYKLAKFPWDESMSEHYAERLENLKALVARARQRGIGIYLYLNEPRAMLPSFFTVHPELKGVEEGGLETLCTSVPAVQDYLTDSVESICRAVPDLAGIFTITASENLTNCWSHYRGADCPRCSKRGPAEVIAEVDTLIEAGIRKAGTKTRLIAWDWGWQNQWADKAIGLLPDEAALMCVSELDLPIKRGGIDSVIAEYSISAIGPGPRALSHWATGRARELKTLAKIQAGNTWELSAVPYIPAVANVAQHAANLREAKVDGLMLGWMLGGYPSPNIEVVDEVFRGDSPEAALEIVAKRRYGKAGPAIAEAWREYSRAFSEFPFHGSMIYNAPMQTGPGNLLWEEPTGYAATMVGFPYDDLKSWIGIYPADVFIGQFNKMADGFDAAFTKLSAEIPQELFQEQNVYAEPLKMEMNVERAAAIHFRSVANQARFVTARDALASAKSDHQAAELMKELDTVLRSEIEQAKELYAIQVKDSRMGFEATNQYYYTPMDLAEKVLNCRDLLDRWLQVQHGHWDI